MYVWVPLLMRCHLNVKQAEPRPHAAIRYEVTDAVCAGQKWMAGEGSSGSGGAGALVAQGPAFRIADSYLSRGEIKKRDQQSWSPADCFIFCFIRLRCCYVPSPPRPPPFHFLYVLPFLLLHLPARTAAHRNLPPSALIEQLLSQPRS